MVFVWDGCKWFEMTFKSLKMVSFPIVAQNRHVCTWKRTELMDKKYFLIIVTTFRLAKTIWIYPRLQLKWCKHIFFVSIRARIERQCIQMVAHSVENKNNNNEKSEIQCWFWLRISFPKIAPTATIWQGTNQNAIANSVHENRFNDYISLHFGWLDNYFIICIMNSEPLCRICGVSYTTQCTPYGVWHLRQWVFSGWTLLYLVYTIEIFAWFHCILWPLIVTGCFKRID